MAIGFHLEYYPISRVAERTIPDIPGNDGRIQNVLPLDVPVRVSGQCLSAVICGHAGKRGGGRGDRVIELIRCGPIFAKQCIWIRTFGANRVNLHSAS